MNAPTTSLFAAEAFAEWVVRLTPDAVPPAARETARRALLDHVGLAVSARREP
jgi:2-methylcitrate dehydratase PrpD